jgi:hypothetical protein
MQFGSRLRHEFNGNTTNLAATTTSCVRRRDVIHPVWLLQVISHYCFSVALGPCQSISELSPSHTWTFGVVLRIATYARFKSIRLGLGGERGPGECGRIRHIMLYADTMYGTSSRVGQGLCLGCNLVLVTQKRTLDKMVGQAGGQKTTDKIQRKPLNEP